jgi:hypothetical protein
MATVDYHLEFTGRDLLFVDVFKDEENVFLEGFLDRDPVSTRFVNRGRKIRRGFPGGLQAREFIGSEDHPSMVETFKGVPFDRIVARGQHQPAGGLLVAHQNPDGWSRNEAGDEHGPSKVLERSARQFEEHSAMRAGVAGENDRAFGKRIFPSEDPPEKMFQIERLSDNASDAADANF